MNALEHTLTTVSEEAIELANASLIFAQTISKALRFGLHDIGPDKVDNNVTNMNHEYNDLLAMVELMEEKHNVVLKRDQGPIDAKKARYAKFLQYSKVVRDDVLPVSDIKEVGL